jgi:dephospho-CoA kinase
MSPTRDPAGFRVGLTGGIASGKSLVADEFAALGVPVIDTDIVARQVVEPGEPALAQIAERFGSDVLTADGRLDRRRLRDHVFADAAERKALEAILHPVIRERSLAAAADADGPYQLLVVPLLIETDFRRLVDRILVVDCPESLQLERLLARDGEDPQQARRMMDAQIPRANRLAAADDVIDNSSSRAATRRQVAALHTRYLELARAGS